VAREIQVPVHEVEEWRRVFLESGQQGLKRRGLNWIGIGAMASAGASATGLGFSCRQYDMESSFTLPRNTQ
jgi:hypothetical protein